MKYRKLASGFVAAAMAVGVFATPFGDSPEQLKHCRNMWN